MEADMQDEELGSEAQPQKDHVPQKKRKANRSPEMKPQNKRKLEIAVWTD